MNNVKIFFVNILEQFPKNPFSFDSFVENLREFLPVLNWFIPFYKLAPIFNVWLTFVLVSIMTFFVYRMIKKGVFHD